MDNISISVYAMNVAIFWDIALSSPCVNQRFKGTSLPSSSGLKISQARKHCAAGG
jgi:hypothetical protein